MVFYLVFCIETLLICSKVPDVLLVLVKKNTKVIYLLFFMHLQIVKIPEKSIISDNFRNS